MTDQNQDDIDALLGGMDGDPKEGENPDGLENSGADSFSPARADNTGDSPEVQAEESTPLSNQGGGKSISQAKTPTGTAWVDYIPEDLRPRPENLMQRLERAIEDANGEFTERELLIRKWYISGDKINIAYYKSWIFHGNKLFRGQVILRMRRAQIEASRAREEGKADLQDLAKEGKAS